MDEEVPLLTFDAQSFYEGAEIYIIKDMPDIQQVSQTDYIEAVTDVLFKQLWRQVEIIRALYFA